MIREALVPVAGAGTRLLPATKAQPKEMLPVGGRPVVQRVIEELAAAGVDRVVFVTGRGKDAISDHFDPDPSLIALLRGSGREDLLARLDFERLGLSYAYVRQPAPRGLGDAVARGEPVIGDRPFLVALGDSIVVGSDSATEPPLPARLSAAVEAGAACAVAVELVSSKAVSDYGIAAGASAAEAEIAESSRESFALGGLIEKPDAAFAPSRWAVAGRYAFGSGSIFAALRELPPPGPGDGELQLTDAIAALIDAGRRVVAVPLAQGERRLDTGTPAGYAATFVELALADPEVGTDLRAMIAELLDADHPG